MVDYLLEEGRMTSFKEYAEGKDLRRHAPSTDSWFNEHPDLATQVTDARDDGWSWAQIFDWLRAEHAYPMKNPTSIRKWMLGR